MKRPLFTLNVTGRRFISVEKSVRKPFSVFPQDLLGKTRKADAVGKITTVNHQSPITNYQPRKILLMKRQMTMRIPLCNGLTLALALAMWAPGQAFAAEAADGNGMTDAQMMKSCHDMQAQKQKLNQDVKVQDAALADQCAKMNSAPENQKAGMLIILVTNMVEQKCAMDARRGDMEDAMMKHTMQHMQMGKESMQGCPMMKGMKGTDEKIK